MYYEGDGSWISNMLILGCEVWDRYADDDSKSFSILLPSSIIPEAGKERLKERKRERSHSSLKAWNDSGICLVQTQEVLRTTRQGKLISNKEQQSDEYTIYTPSR